MCLLRTGLLKPESHGGSATCPSDGPSPRAGAGQALQIQAARCFDEFADSAGFRSKPVRAEKAPRIDA